MVLPGQPPVIKADPLTVLSTDNSAWQLVSRCRLTRKRHINKFNVQHRRSRDFIQRSFRMVDFGGRSGAEDASDPAIDEASSNQYVPVLKKGGIR
jgi:hypothetical protein